MKKTFRMAVTKGPPVETAYYPLTVEVGDRKWLLALHRSGPLDEWRVSDPRSGRKVLDVSGARSSSRTLKLTAAKFWAGHCVQALAQRVGADVFALKMEGALLPPPPPKQTP